MNSAFLPCPYWCRTNHEHPLSLVHCSVEIPIPAVVLDVASLRATTLAMSLRRDFSGSWAVIEETPFLPFAVADISTMNRLVDAWDLLRPDEASPDYPH